MCARREVNQNPHAGTKAKISGDALGPKNNCNCNLDTPTRGTREGIQYMHKVILEEREGKSEFKQ